MGIQNVNYVLWSLWMTVAPPSGRRCSIAVPRAFFTSAAGPMTIDRPRHDTSAERVENDGAVHPALASRVFAEIGGPELIAPLSPELALHVIPRPRRRDVPRPSVARSARESL